MKSWIAGLLLALFFAPWTLAQQASDQTPRPTIRARVEMVNVLVTVRDRKGRYITDLDETSFTILEDGVPQQIQFFSNDTGEDARPLTIALLIDTSGSVKEKLLFEQTAALEFFQSTLRPKKDLAAIVQFDTDINVVQDFTFDLPTLTNAIRGIRAGGATKLYDAIFLATDEMLRHQTGRHVMVVLSDGQDTDSVYTKDQSIRMAQEQDVIIFGIGVKAPNSDPNFKALENFSRATGGDFFKSKLDLARLREAFRRINAEIKNQYSIAYVSKNTRRDGIFREVEVKVNKRGLKVGHRRGYYAPQPYSSDGR